jgi:hypothetical protein
MGKLLDQKLTSLPITPADGGVIESEVTAVKDLKGRANHPGEPRLGEDASPYHPTSISYGTLV